MIFNIYDPLYRTDGMKSKHYIAVTHIQEYIHVRVREKSNTTDYTCTR